MADAGQVANSSVSVVVAGRDPIDVSLFGVEPGRPGEPPAFEGRNLGRARANEVVIDERLVRLTGLAVGDTLTVRSIQGTNEEFYDLAIVGTTDGRAYFIQPGIFVPYLTFEKVKPQGENEQGGNGEYVSNIVAVKLVDPAQIDVMAEQLETLVGGIEAVDRKTAYEAAPGYSAQMSTLSTQRISPLDRRAGGRGFFQIQTLQKVAQVGMLKAIGASNRTVALSAIAQIVTLNALGVALGTAGSLALSLTFPPAVPITFTGDCGVRRHRADGDWAVGRARLGLSAAARRAAGGAGLGPGEVRCRKRCGADAVTKVKGRGQCGDRRQPGLVLGHAGRVRRFGRAERLGQDDAPGYAGGASLPDRRRDPDRGRTARRIQRGAAHPLPRPRSVSRFSRITSCPI